MIPTYAVACTAKKLIAHEVYEVSFTKPEGFAFRGGQFVLFDVPHPDDPANIQTRAFSLASAPDEDTLLFVIKLVAGGRASRWIEEKVEEGAEVVMKGPFGNFTLDRAAPHDYLFIATSTGVAPFRSQILEAAGAGDARRMDLVFGVRAESDLFWMDEMRRIAETYPSVFLHVALSSPSESWKGHRGRVQTLVPQIIADFSQKSVYVCGNPDMTKEVKQLALAEWGIDRKSLHVEGYI